MEEPWRGSMPPEVTELILKRLPIRVLNQFRVVCREWQTLISKLHTPNYIGPPFKEQWMLMIPTEPHGDVLHAFLPEKIKWHTIILPKKISAAYPFIDAAGGNLICMSDHGHSKGSFTRVVVCNPLMRTWTDLPELQFPGEIKSMGVNPETNAFKIIATFRSNWGKTYAEIYDSGDDRWSRVEAPFPAAIALETPPVYFNSRFYFLDNSFNLHGLDMVSRVWIWRPTSGLFLGIGVTCEDKKLIGSDGQIFLFTAEVDLYAKRDFTIWRLKDFKWERAARPPWSISSHYLNNCKSFSVWATATKGVQSIYLKNVLSCRVAHVDLHGQSEGEWNWIPDYSPVPSRTVLQAIQV